MLSLIGSNSLIGNATIDILPIYARKSHSLKHAWAAICLPKSESHEIKGFLKFSVCIVAEGDKQEALDDEIPENQKGVKSTNDVDQVLQDPSFNILLPP